MVSPEIVVLSVHEADEHPPGHQRGLGRDDRLEQREVGVLGLRRARMVTADRVVGEATQQVDVARGPGVLEGAHAQVAGGHPGEDRSRQQGLAAHGAPGRHDGERAGRRDAEGVHRLADDVLAQHRPDHRQPVAAAGERRAPRPLEMQVAQAATGIDELAEQERPPVTEPRGVPAELVPGVGLRHRRRTAGDGVADEQPHALGAAQRDRVEAELGGKPVVEHQQPRVRRLVGLPRDRQLRQLTGEAVAEGDGRGGCEAHPSHGTDDPSAPGSRAGPSGRRARQAGIPRVR
jgi:hypothetical protein